MSRAAATMLTLPYCDAEEMPLIPAAIRCLLAYICHILRLRRHVFIRYAADDTLIAHLLPSLLTLRLPRRLRRFCQAPAMLMPHYDITPTLRQLRYCRHAIITPCQPPDAITLRH